PRSPGERSWWSWRQGVGFRPQESERSTEMTVRRFAWIVAAALCGAASVYSQQPASGTAAPDLSPVSNPVSGAVKAQLPRFQKNMVAAAEAMPAEKYNFKPTPEMNSFAHLVMHIAQSNNGLCAKISDTPAPDAKMADTDPKEKLVAALKASFEYCATSRSEERRVGKECGPGRGRESGNRRR